jgi:transcriptional regulator with XRE-family HTH domain
MAKKPDPVDVLVGRNIRLYRIAAEFSQIQLGNKIGVTFQQVQKYEKGTNRVGASRLNMIAKALNVPLARLFDGVESDKTKGGSNQTATLIAEPHAFRLASAFAKISDSDVRRNIVQLVESIAVHNRSSAK